jgi:hypothetical protein
MGIFDSKSSTTQNATEIGLSESFGVVNDTNLYHGSELSITSISTDPALIDASTEILSNTLEAGVINLDTAAGVINETIGFAGDSLDFADAASDNALDFAGGALDVAADTFGDSLDFAGNSFGVFSEIFGKSLEFAGGLVDDAIDSNASSTKSVIDTVNTIQSRESLNNDARISELSNNAIKGAVLLGIAAMGVMAFKG